MGKEISQQENNHSVQQSICGAYDQQWIGEMYKLHGIDQINNFGVNDTKCENIHSLHSGKK